MQLSLDANAWVAYKLIMMQNTHNGAETMTQTNTDNLTLATTTAAMRDHDRTHTPGSESGWWDTYCEDCRANYRVLPDHDGAGDTPIGDEFSAYWIAVAEHRWDDARRHGDVEHRDTHGEWCRCGGWDEVDLDDFDCPHS